MMMETMGQGISTGCSPSKVAMQVLRKLLLLLVMLAAFLGISEARATTITCSAVSMPDMAVNLSSANFPRDAAIGSASSPVTATFTLQCNADPLADRDFYITFTPTPATLVAGYTNVYATNLTGIGVRYTITSAVETGPNVAPPACKKTVTPPLALASSSTQLVCHYLQATGTYTFALTVQAQLIKTASSTLGTLTSLPAISISGSINNQSGSWAFGNLFSGAASGTFANLACTTPNVSVVLGQHHTSELGGVGTTSAAASFNIDLNNCQAGMNSIKYEIDPSTSIVAGTGNSVVTLDAGSKASGLGLQLLDGNGNPLALGTPVTFAGYNGATGGSYQIPLRARYYQTGPTINAGSANTEMTFTMSYL